MDSLPSIYEMTCTDAHLTLRQDGNYDLIINYLTEDGRKITVEGIVGNIRPQVELSYGSCFGTIDFAVKKTLIKAIIFLQQGRKINDLFRNFCK